MSIEKMKRLLCTATGLHSACACCPAIRPGVPECRRPAHLQLPGTFWAQQAVERPVGAWTSLHPNPQSPVLQQASLLVSKLTPCTIPRHAFDKPPEVKSKRLNCWGSAQLDQAGGLPSAGHTLDSKHQDAAAWRWRHTYCPSTQHIGLKSDCLGSKLDAGNKPVDETSKD